MEERIDIHKQAMEFYSQTHDVPRTWRMVRRLRDVSVGLETVRSWVKKEKSPVRKFHGRIITMASPSLAYVIMAAKGDGCAGRRENGEKGFLYNIELKVRDFDFANSFAMSASAALNRSHPYKIRVDKTGFCCVTIHSRALFELLGKIPSSYLHCRRYLGSTHAISRMGIRGFFDAEGGPSVSVNNRGEFAGEIVAGNSNLKLIKLVQKLLRKEGIASTLLINKSPPHAANFNGRTVWFSKMTHMLRISRIPDVLRFVEIIGSGIGRKRVKLNDIKACLKLRARERVDAWLALYHKNDKGEYEREMSQVGERHPNLWKLQPPKRLPDMQSVLEG